MAAVPRAPGVPALLTGTDSALTARFSALTADAISGLGEPLGPTWGIFRGGSAVVSADTVSSFEYRQEWIIADYPIEGGSFESYDKVQTPYDVRIRFVAGGSEAAKTALLASVAAIAGDYNLYDAVTPQSIYLSCNVRHYDYRRTAQNGLGLLTVDIFLAQIRINNTSGTTSVANASGADQVNGGSVQPQTPDAAQQSAGDGAN